MKLAVAYAGYYMKKNNFHVIYTLSLKHRFVPSLLILLQRINEDIAFSSLETCTEIGSNQTIKPQSDKGLIKVHFYITQSCTQEALFGFSLATEY